MGPMKVRRHRAQRSTELGVERLIEGTIYDSANETPLIVVDSSPVIEAVASAKPREPFSADLARGRGGVINNVTHSEQYANRRIVKSETLLRIYNIPWLRPAVNADV